MGILEIIGIIAGSGGIGSFVTWAVHLQANKRLKEAEAALSESTAESMQITNNKDRFEAMYVLITKMLEDYNNLSDEYRKYRQGATSRELSFQKKIDDKCEELAVLRSLVQYLKGLRCYDTACLNRVKFNPDKLK